MSLILKPYIILKPYSVKIGIYITNNYRNANFTIKKVSKNVN